MRGQNGGRPQSRVFSLKKEGRVTPAVAWVNLEAIMPNEIGQPQKDKHSVIPLMEDPRFIKTQRQKVERWLPGAGDRRES